MKRRLWFPAVTTAMTVVVLAVLVAASLASPPSGVTPTLLARGTYDSFALSSKPFGRGDFKMESRTATDIIVRRHDYLPGSTTGWHSHPGPVFITVTQGQLTFYAHDDPTCTPHVVSAGQGYVDNGRGHIGRNETGQPAQDFSVIIAPVAGAFRGELDAPGPYCDF